MIYVEHKLKRCRKCGTTTTHARNNHKMGAFMWLLAIVMIVITGGAWILVMAVWMALTHKFGGWKCKECMKWR